MGDTVGPLLVRAGLISNLELYEAHEALRGSDRTLSEQLVAQGMLDEGRLCEFFRQRLLVPHVTLMQLQRVPKNVLSQLSPDIAAEFRVVPYQLDRDGGLVLAMADPSDTHAVDEISFFVGTSILRAVAGPTSIAWALHHYYGLVTPLLTVTPRDPILPPRPHTTTLPGTLGSDHTGPVLADAQTDEHDNSPEADQALAAALDALTAADGRDQVATALVAYLGALCRRAAFFVVRKATLTGWSGAGIGVAPTPLKTANLDLGCPSVFRDVVTSRLPYRGPVSDAPSRDFLIDALGWAPQDMLALPVAVRQRVVGILYGDGRRYVVPDEHLGQVIRVAGEALYRALAHDHHPPA